jgi:hypothetical protein
LRAMWLKPFFAMTDCLRDRCGVPAFYIPLALS